MVVIRAGIKKLLVRIIANREEPDLTASSDLGLPCLHRTFCKATSVGNFRKSIVIRTMAIPVNSV